MKHKLFSKRGLALVVSVMMCLSAMSTTAWAGNFKDLQDKINAAVESGDGNVVLGEDYTYGENGTEDNTTITINKDITLNLNGWTISGADKNNNSVITVGNKGNLTLKDEKVEKANTDADAVGTITGGQGSFGGDRKTEGGGVKVTNGGTFTMNGGTITGNTVEARGGGVYVETNGTFTMTGGTITKNEATNGNGGGVSMWDGGKFEMNGGTISANTAKNGGGVYATGGSSQITITNGKISNNTALADGGGIFVTGSHVTMNSGTISGNTTTRHNYSAEGKANGGGGVYVSGGADFIMNDGEISKNTAGTSVSEEKHGASGGGVYVVDKGSKFTMNGGTISDNTANGTGEGGGIYGKGEATIEMNGGKITGNEAKDNYTNGGGGVRVWRADFTMNGGIVTDNIAAGSPNNISDKDNGTHTVTIKHGTISAADATKYANGKKTTTDTDGNVIVHQAPAEDAKLGYDAEGHWSICGADSCNVSVSEKEKHTFADGWVIDEAATCAKEGQKHRTCVCGYTETETTSMVAHSLETVAEVPATCTTDGTAAGQKCKNCDYHIGMGTIPANGHGSEELGVVVPATAEANGYRTYVCSVCKFELRRETLTWTAPGGDDDNTGDTDTEDPGTVVIPDPDVPLGDEPAPAVTIADEDVPLAGLVTLAQLLDELHRHEGAPEVHIPDGFPFADHEYAEAICWGLDNALVFHTEEEPLDPDEIVTVGLMREVLTNFVAYRGVEEFTVELAGADDEIVMDLGERLVVFYAQLAEAEAAAETDETEAA